MKTLSLAVLLVVAGVIPSFAGETGGSAAAPATTQDVQQVLDRLQGQPGLFGAGSAEMAVFMSMVQTPELTRIVERLNRQLLEQGDPETMDLQAVSAFVRQNLTLQDAERILGQRIERSEYQEAVRKGGESENLDQLVKMLR